MKLLFLDIDGVLNCPTTTVHYPEGSLFYGIEPEKVALLNRILTATGAKVVVSSTWRKHHPIPELTAYLEAQGFKGELIGYTPLRAWHRYFRGDEVKMFLQTHERFEGPVEKHVILDDDGDFDPEQPLVQTDSRVGLTEADVERAVEFLR